MKSDRLNKNRRRGVPFALLAAGLFIIITGLVAQPLMAKSRGWSGPRHSPDEILQMLTERLDLTLEQINAIRPIIEEKHRKMIDLQGKIGDDRKAARTQKMKLKWETEMQLGAILTDEQVDKYLELKQEQRKEFRKGKHRGGWMKKGMHKTPEQVIERLRTRIDLTEEQAVQAGPIIKESIDKRRMVFEKYRDQGLKVKQAMRSEMQAIGDATHTELATILSDEQMEELNAMKEEKRARMEK